MPSHLHEALVELFRVRPVLVAELLGRVPGVVLPEFARAGLASGDLTDTAPTEHRADAVVVLTGAEGPPIAAVVVEAQLGRDSGKRWTWPAYLATLRSRLRCPAILLVVCPDDAIAAWCATPIDLGHPGWQLCPIVAGPDVVPMITDPEEAGSAPELAVLSALAHGGGAGGEPVLDALVGALVAVDETRAALYCDVVLATLPVAARRYLEALMLQTYKYQSEFALRYVAQGRAEGEAEGEARGEAKALLGFLRARRIAVPPAARERITSCTDLGRLDEWIQRAATATSVDDLFDGTAPTSHR